MSDQHQDLTGGEALDQAKEYAQEHPAQAKGAIDALEDKLDEVTGGRFRDVIDKGGEYLEEEFGIPADVSQNPPADLDPDAPAEPAPVPDEAGGGQTTPDPKDPTS